MYYALATILGVALGMVIMCLMVSAAREDEHARHVIELKEEYERGYRQAKFQQQTELNMWCGYDLNEEA